MSIPATASLKAHTREPGLSPPALNVTSCQDVPQWVSAGSVYRRPKVDDLKASCSRRAATPHGTHALQRWPELIATLPEPVHFQQAGTLIVWHRQDAAEARRFAALLERTCAALPQVAPPQALDGPGLAEIEPALAGRFPRGLLLPGEGQLDNRALLQSLRSAQRIVALQSAARDDIPAELLPKLKVIYQSCTSRKTLTKTHRYLRLIVVGHLRSEKAPQTVFELARRLRTETAIRIDHIGRALDDTLGEQARDLSATSPVYRWLGECSYPVTRQRIQRAHLLLHPSRVEGGAHVIMEAVCSGTPVLASRIAGNVGMLGRDYPGYFEFDDVESLAALVLRCRVTMAGPQPWLDELGRYCQRRAVQFSPEHERAALLSLVHGLL